MEELIPVVAIVSVFGSVILLVKTITDYLLKRKLVDKNMAGEEVSNLFMKNESKLSALKWGLVTLFAGIGLIIIYYTDTDADTALPYGIEAVCVAIGFLIYFALARKEMEND